MRDDHLVVIGAYLEHRSVNLPATEKAELAELVGCSYASIAFKLGTIDAHLAGGALTSGSRMTRDVADELIALDARERRKVVAAARERLRRD
jgi:hypothetical protein